MPKFVGAIDVNGAYTLPTADGSANQVLKTDGSGTVSFANEAGGGGSPGGSNTRTFSSTTLTLSVVLQTLLSMGHQQ